MVYNGIPFEQLGAPWHHPVAVSVPPNTVLHAPASTWGIAYDLLVHNTEDPLGGGWHKRRGMLIQILVSNADLMNITASVYREINRLLKQCGFYQAQYSVWQRRGTALQAWMTMMDLRGTRPPGVFATVVRCLQMYHVPRRRVLMVTNRVQLGGVSSPTLLGPTPAALAQGMGHIPPAPWPNGPGDRLPFGVRRVPTSLDPNNWRVG